MPSLPDPATPSLLELAIARLRQLFPKDYQRMIKAVAQLPPPSANVAEAKRAAPPPQPAANGRCSVKGCVFPAVVGPLCRSSRGLAGREIIVAEHDADRDQQSGVPDRLIGYHGERSPRVEPWPRREG